MQIGYLDPASGSIIASALVGGAAAFGVAAKSARKRVTGVFKKNRDEEAAPAEVPAEAPAADADATVDSDA
jgi:hypothetical protein